jgi:hypothetical protein
LNTDNLDEILRRFHNFDDAVLEGFSITFPNKQKFGIGEFVLLARDSTNGEADSWFRVTLKVDGVAEFRLTENSRSSSRVLSSGLKVLLVANRIWVFFDQDERAVSVDEARRSEYYVCSTTCTAVISSLA